MKNYFNATDDFNELNCVNEFYEYINQSKIEDINNFYTLIKIKL